MAEGPAADARGAAYAAHHQPGPGRATSPPSVAASRALVPVGKPDSMVGEGEASVAGTAVSLKVEASVREATSRNDEASTVVASIIASAMPPASPLPAASPVPPSWAGGFANA